MTEYQLGESIRGAWVKYTSTCSTHTINRLQQFHNSIQMHDCAVLLYISTLCGAMTDSTDAVTRHKHSELTSCHRVYDKYYKERKKARQEIV